MRSPLLTRSAVAVASLAIGAAALAAAPASADTPSGVTRQTILTSSDQNFSDATRTLIQRVCGTTSISDYDASDLQQSDAVAGVLVQAFVEYQEDVPGSGRYCTFAALAPTEPFSDLSGTVTISADDQEGDLSQAAVRSQGFTLSGDVFVTPPISDSAYAFSSDAEASGTVTKVEQATTTNTRVSTPKSTQVKKAALRSYKRSIASAQKRLSSALEKAGDSSSKKRAARTAFAARKKAAKKTLHLRWSSDKKTVVTTTVGRTTTIPFSISTNRRG